MNNYSGKDSLPLGTDWQTVSNTIKKFPADGMTPTIDSYIDAAVALDKGIEYRCQKNYLVVVSDGDSNHKGNLTRNTGLEWTNSSRQPILPRHLYYQWLTLNQKLNDSAFWRKILSSPGFNRTQSKTSSKFLSMCNPIYLQRPREIKSQQYAQNICNNLPSQFVYYPYNGVSDGNYYNYTGGTALSRLTSDLDFLDANTAKYETIGYVPLFSSSHAGRSGDMLRYLSEPLHKSDLRTTANGTDKTGKSWDDPVFPMQNITTFTIGFGESISKNGQDLLRGGASDITQKNGTTQRAYYTATDQNGLIAAFGAIFQQIENENPPPTQQNPVDLPVVSMPSAPQPDPNGTPTKSEPSVTQESSYVTSPPSTTGANNSIPSMAATLYLPAGLHSSELRFYGLNKAVADTTKWRVADFSERKALISDGNGVRWVGEQSQAGRLNNIFFGLPADAQQRTDEWRTALLPWLTRQVPNDDDTKIKALGYPTPYRIRPVPPTDSPRNTLVDEYNMGDVLDAPIQAIGANGPAQGNRQEFLITAANDGMVYLFQSHPDANAKYPYSLKLNYLPAAMPRQTLSDTHAKYYQDLAHENYGKDSSRPHLFMINGGMTLRTTPVKGNNQHTFMVGALAQGGRGMYALSIGGTTLDTGEKTGLHADSKAWNTSVPLYETNPAVNSSDYGNLGYTVGYPQIGRLLAKYNSDGSLPSKLESDVYYASFLASGFSYPNGTQETALYIQDALGLDVGGGKTKAAVANGNVKGKLLAKVVVPGGVGGLASPTLLDVNRDGVYDYAFAGDYGGNMYRFDLRKIDLNTGSVGSGAVKRIYAGSPDQPITAAPAVAIQNNGREGRYVVAFGTGSDMYASDFNSKKEQAVYGIYQRFDNGLNPVDLNDPLRAEATAVPQASDLLEQKFTTNSQQVNNVTVTTRLASDHAILNDNSDVLKFKGWKIGLGTAFGDQDGERVVVTPTVVLGTLILSSRIYKEKAVQNVNNNPWNENTWQADGWIKVNELLDQNRKEGSWSTWADVPSSESSITKGDSGDVCTGTVTTTTKVQQRKRNVTYDTISTYERVHPSQNESSGWVLVLNSANGGAIKVSSGAPGIDFLKQFNADSFDSSAASNKDAYFLSGAYSNSGLPNFALLSSSNKHLYGKNTGMTRDGTATNSGEDGDLTDGGEKLTPGCFDNKDNYVLLSGSKIGLGDTLNLLGSVCKNKSASLRRLSWREIF